jgi:Ser/Thr protein kinase RdoA (MazF antagonist)
MLLRDIPGEDMYGAPSQILNDMVTLLVQIQKDWVNRTNELLELGLPDYRAPALVSALKDIVERVGAQLTETDRATLASFVDGLNNRLAEVSRCGLPNTLVHGDFHPGNFHGDDTRTFVLMDWGDSCVGHPLLDEPSFMDRVSVEDAPHILEHWHNEWRTAVPGSDPGRASQLLAPVAAARAAVVYQRFLENIEPSERPYHQADPAQWLRRAAALARNP